MKKVITKTENNEKLILEINRVDSPFDPREEENIGNLICFGDERHLGDNHMYHSVEECLEELVSDAAEEGKLPAKYRDSDLVRDLEALELLELVYESDMYIMLPIFVYEHGGITMNTVGCSCTWDSSQVGFIYARKDTFEQETGYTSVELFDGEPSREPVVGEHVIRKEEGSSYGMVREVAGDEVLVDFDYNKIPSARKKQNIVWIKKEEIEALSNKAETMLRNEVKEYASYLEGETYSMKLSKTPISEDEEEIIYEEGVFLGNELRKNGMLEELGPYSKYFEDEKWTF